MTSWCHICHIGFVHLKKKNCYFLFEWVILKDLFSCSEILLFYLVYSSNFGFDSECI